MRSTANEVILKHFGDMQSPRQTAVPSKYCATLDFSRRLRMDGSRPHLIPLMPLTLVAMVISGAIVFSGSEGFSQSSVTVIAIAKMEIGSAPADFDFALTGQGGPGQWRIVSDTTSFTGRVIEQSSSDRTDYRFPLAIFNSVVAKNADVSASFKPVAGHIDQAGGIAVRVHDSNNYYVVRANALEDNVRLYRIVKGRREQIGGVNTKVASGVWHTLGLKAEGERFTIGFDGKTLFTASDRTFADAGKIALWTKADSITRFDQISIDVLP